MFCVKLYDVETAIELCRPMIAEHTGVISFQNGIGSEAKIDEVAGAGHAIGGIAYAPIAIESPGVILHTGNMARLAYGEMDGRSSDRVTAFHDACQTAGISSAINPDIKKAL